MIAFVATAFCGGANAVAIRLGNAELAPFWGASLRFLLAGLILVVVVGVTRRALPRGRALAGVVIYGALNFFAAYMFAYWALQEVTAGTAQVVLAIVPLLTLGLAVAQGVERFRLRGAAGGALAAAGIALVFRDRVDVTSPSALAALVAGAFCIAEVAIVVKRFPRVDPVVMNALGMTIGGGLLLALSVVTSEPHALPTEPRTWASLAYLVVVGSIGLFILYLFVLRRWTATGTSYLMLLMPLITVALGTIILGEAVSPAFLVGGLFVLAGVYVGAIAPAARPKATEIPSPAEPVRTGPQGLPVPVVAAVVEPARVTLPPCA